jgi:hypothetical protein
MKRKMIIIIILAYLVFVIDFKISYANKTHVYILQYNGLLWVALDLWSIKKYNSNDTPLKYVEISRACL